MKQFLIIALIVFGILLWKTNERACAFRAGITPRAYAYKK